MKTLRLMLVMIVLTGLVYPIFVTGVAQTFMNDKADGSFIKQDGKTIGSKLIGQNFTKDRYFHGRISSIDYNASGSGSNNYAPSNKDMKERTAKAVDVFLTKNPTVKREDIPADLVTNSGSGLDPDISVQAALVQVDRVAKARQLEAKAVKQLVLDNVTKRSLGVFGEERINVLQLNIALDKLEEAR